MRRASATAAAAALVALALGPAAQAARVRSHDASAESLRAGRIAGVAVSSNGELSAAPVLRRLTSDGDARADHVWTVVSAPDGTVFLGTGPDGLVQRVRPAGGASAHARVPEPLVTALAVEDDGSLIAGTSPNGRVYRIDPGGDVELWAETGARYVWDLARTADGRLFAATGEPGGVVRISSSGETRTWFDAEDAHVVVLTPIGERGLLAGSAGSGLLYRLDGDGRPIVLHDDELPEIADVAVLPDGDVVAAAVAPPPGALRRPALRIRLPGDPRFGEAGAVEALDEGAPVEVEGLIEGLAPTGPDDAERLRGRLVRIDPDAGVRELWRSAVEAPFTVAVDAGGRALFATGEPARVYAIEGELVSLVATLDEGQGTGLVPRGDGAIVATSNPAAAYLLSWSHGEAGVYVSPVVDAGGPARWGTIRWWTDRFPSPVEMFTRTGGSARPDASWSAWSPALTSPGGSAIVNPDGRYLQWRVRIPGGSAVDARVAGVRVTFEPYNRGPELDAARIDGGRDALADGAAWTWKVRDLDGDPLVVRVEARRPADAAWTELARTTVAEAPAAALERWRDGRLQVDLSGLAEGSWEFRVRVDDAAANRPGEGGVAWSRERLVRVVDRTPPRARIAGREGDVVVVEAADDGSGLREAVVLEDGAPAFLAGADDGVCDGAAETFRIRLPPTTDARTLGLRLRDGAGNEAVLEIAP